MLKTMLFSEPSGRGSWVLEFTGKEFSTIRSLSLGENGILYVAGDAFRQLSDTEKVRNCFSAGIDTKGTVLWQRYFGETGDSTDNRTDDGCITAIGSNAVASGQEVVSSSSKNTHLCLYSADGDDLRVKKLIGTNNIGIYLQGINSCGNYVYVYGNYIAKLAKDLTSASWIKHFIHDIKGVDCDPNSGNIYFCGEDTSGGTSIYIGSLSSTGKVLWVRELGDNDERALDICVSNEVYVCGYTKNTDDGYFRGIVAKYSKTGNLSWKKEATYDKTHTSAYSINFDTSGNIYVGGKGGKNKISGYLIKLSSNGSVLSNIEITHQGLGTTINHIQIDAEGNVYMYNNSKSIIKLTKDDLEKIATTNLSVGNINFTKGSININSSYISSGNASTSEKNYSYSLASSTYVSREANITSELYRG